MSHFGTHAHRSRLIFPSNRKEPDLRFELVASKATWSHWFRRDKAFATKTDNRTYAQVLSQNKPCLVSDSNPKWVPVKPTTRKFQANLPNCVTSTSRAYVQRPLQNKCCHVTAPVLVNSRFEVLASHADTSDAVFDETPVNKTLHPQYRVNTKQAAPFASSDINLNASDPACQVLPSESQVSNNTCSFVQMQNHSIPSTVVVRNTQCTDDVSCSQKVNTSLFSQPNAVGTPQCIDLKANVGSSAILNVLMTYHVLKK